MNNSLYTLLPQGYAPPGHADGTRPHGRGGGPHGVGGSLRAGPGPTAAAVALTVRATSPPGLANGTRPEAAAVLCLLYFKGLQWTSNMNSNKGAVKPTQDFDSFRFF